MRDLLTGAARDEALAPLTATGWAVSEGGTGIVKTFKFKSFAKAFGWMAEIAIRADKLDHHPEWSNVYNKVEVLLTTHSAGGITELDVKLATAMDKAAG